MKDDVMVVCSVPIGLKGDEHFDRLTERLEHEVVLWLRHNITNQRVAGSIPD
jgi:hypothetical protein